MVCPVPGVCRGLLFLNELQSLVHHTHTCPCFHQGNKVRERNTGCVPTYLLFVYPLGTSVPNTDGKQQAAVALRGDASLFYLQKRLLVSGSVHCCIEVLVACNELALASCQASTQPLSALLNCIAGRSHNKKPHGSRWREITKPMYHSAMFSSDTLCQQNDISVMRVRKQMKKMIAHCMAPGVPKLLGL